MSINAPVSPCAIRPGGPAQEVEQRDLNTPLNPSPCMIANRCRTLTTLDARHVFPLFLPCRTQNRIGHMVHREAVPEGR